jgi:hypothetical protein
VLVATGGWMLVGPRSVPRAAAAIGVRASSITISEDGAPRVTVDLSGLADTALRARLESGLAQTIVTRIDALDARDTAHPVATVVRTCHVRYDAWERRYHVRIETARDVAVSVAPSIEAALDLCLDLHALEVGQARDWRGVPTAAVSFVALVELNPLSRESALRVHSWLERSGGRGERTFFGPFVSSFVDGQVGHAERALTARE